MSKAFLEFEDTSFTRFRRRLLRTKGGSEQRAFLSSVRDNEQFLNEIYGRVKSEGSMEVSLSSHRLTESEFRLPPATTEAELYRIWSNITPRVACRTTFWARVTCRHIEEGRIDSAYLAVEGGSRATGRERIDRVLHGQGENARKASDDCVRAVLLRLGGLPEARGNRSVYVNCPFGRAWWRERLVREVSAMDPSREDEIRDVTRINQEYWETLVSLVVSRNSTFGSRTIRNAFILSLVNTVSKQQKSALRHARRLRDVCKMICVFQASRELSVLNDSEIELLMDEIVQLHHQRA